ncbi:hypothetical protein M011DRAFT_480607 [Sporormia fimetaria CBS 119925]|uniref:Ubiquitination network signaling protein n=1 Tax=Sporormia fimetaria CBS 119925 TaxID=1340428 RepID=A0A6A6V1P8_9PLEO|nr:hypothetical protein M011DRAFT_480607 [Sporormia fimetaria CBS 119925]
MVAKTKRNGGNTHDKRHENGLAAPGKRISKQKSNPQLNGHVNGRASPSSASTPPLPTHHDHEHITSSASPSVAAPANRTAAGSVSEGSGRGDRSAFDTTHDSGDGCRQCEGRPNFDVAPMSARASKGPTYKTDMFTVATTILSSCPLRDVLAILILLLQLPPTVLTIVQFLFATLTFVPPQAGTSLSALSAFPSFTDVFQGSGGTPSLFTVVFADAFILLIWLVLWVPAQNFFLDLAQAVIAIALGGVAAGPNGGSTTNGVFLCVIIILSNHLFRFKPLREHMVHFMWTGLARGGLDFMTSPPSSPPSYRSFTSSHGWLRSLLGIHILAQGLVRMIRRSLSRRDPSPKLLADRKAEPDSAVHVARASSSALEPGADVPVTSPGDGRPPGPPPSALASKERMSSSRKKRKQATQVRSQQPFWAALASTKVTVSKELESSRAANDAAEANAKDINHIGNAVSTGEEDRVWISQVGHADISFRVSMASHVGLEDVQEEAEKQPSSGIDKSKPFYLRVNGADWSSTRIQQSAEDGEEGKGIWTGEIFGLTALTNYLCAFVRTADDQVFFSASLITSPGPVDVQVVSPPPHQALRPSSPTTTLKNSIAAADQKLQDLRNRLKRNRKDHKAGLTAIKKEVETLSNRLANAGGNDERQHQRVRQFNQNIKQADAAAAEFASQIESLGEIPQADLDEAAAKKKMWKKERDHKDALATELEQLRDEIDRQVKNVESDITSVLQKRERLRQRQTALNEKHERLIAANEEGLSAKQRREQERAALRLERQTIENQYRSNINGYERRTHELSISTGNLLATIQHFEHELSQAQQQQVSVPTTPEGPLPGTTTMSPHPTIPFSGFTFPSLTARVNSPPDSLRNGRGRSSSMLSNISGFTDAFDEHYGSPSFAMAMGGQFHNGHGPLNGRKGSHGSGSLSSGTSSQSSSQRDPLSPVPVAKKPPMARSGTGGSAGVSSGLGGR